LVVEIQTDLGVVDMVVARGRPSKLPLLPTFLCCRTESVPYEVVEVVRDHRSRDHWADRATGSMPSCWPRRATLSLMWTLPVYDLIAPGWHLIAACANRVW